MSIFVDLANASEKETNTSVLKYINRMISATSLVVRKDKCLSENTAVTVLRCEGRIQQIWMEQWKIKDVWEGTGTPLKGRQGWILSSPTFVKWGTGNKECWKNIQMIPAAEYKWFRYDYNRGLAHHKTQDTRILWMVLTSSPMTANNLPLTAECKVIVPTL